MWNVYSLDFSITLWVWGFFVYFSGKVFLYLVSLKVGIDFFSIKCYFAFISYITSGITFIFSYASAGMLFLNSWFTVSY